MITFRQISTHDREYAQEKTLRNRVLRMPLGLTLSEQDLQREDRQVHLAAVNERGQVVGCVLVAFSGNSAKVRQIAVEKAYQGRGVGITLMRLAEDAIRARNITVSALHARVTARAFFEKLGYTVASEVFTEVTIPHVEMRKALR